MRVNVYAEEITYEVAIVEKDGHKGLRFFLKSHADIHNTPTDDDRSAVTFWGLSAVGPLMASAHGLLLTHYSRHKSEPTALSPDMPHRTPPRKGGEDNSDSHDPF